MCHVSYLLKNNSVKINVLAGVLAQEAQKYDYKQYNRYFFDTLCFEVPKGISTKEVQKTALSYQMNFKYYCDTCFTISIDETTTLNDINQILEVLAKAAGKTFSPYVCVTTDLHRIFPINTEKFVYEHDIFNSIIRNGNDVTEEMGD